MPRITRIAGSFAIVMIVYWAYALLVVPWIEPPATLNAGGAIPDHVRDAFGESVDPRLARLGELFPPGTLDLKTTKMLESDRAKLLFQTYSNSPDGGVKIDPCIIVYVYEGPAEDEAQRLRQSIVMEAPGGAVLQFDQPFDLNQMKLGRLVGGRLDGQVKIRSGWKLPGPEDDLLIITRDIQLTEKTVSTQNPVDFRWGPHFGRGRQMRIELMPGQAQPGVEISGPNIAGVKSFELHRVERLHLDLGQTMDSPSRKTTGTPVEINCAGPFQFDVVNRVATFRDQVAVMKTNPSGPADQIACDLISMYFTGRGNNKSAANPTGSLDLAAQRIEARGNPVVVTAPSQKVVARGRRLEYDLLAKSITLDGDREVFLQQESNEIHAQSLYYKSAVAGRVGQVVAQGPGWLRAYSADRPKEPLEAFWKKQLRVEPDKQNQLISLTGGAELKYSTMGQLQAKEIFFWLFEIPNPQNSEKMRWRPDRMMARSDVRMNSSQLSSRVEQLEVWFEEAQGVAPRSPQGHVAGTPAGAVAPPAAPTAAPSADPGISPSGLQRFEVAGRLLQARMTIGGPQVAVPNLLIEGGVHFVETQTAQPGERPMMIRGDRLEATNVTGLNAAVSVMGQPARFEARGLGLTGSNINLNRGENRMWIDGAGQMDLPIPANNQNEVLLPPGTLKIDWRRRMEFDGRTATFEDSVVATTPQQQMQTQSMLVHLNQPISFSGPKPKEQPQVESIQCRGGVLIENRSFDPRQQLASYDRLQVSDLAVNVISGAITAGGPGWINSVQHGADNPLGGLTGAAAAPTQSRLFNLYVSFQKSITGNLKHRRLAFSDQVKMTYSPAADWNSMQTTNNPDLLGENGFVIQCDRLSVARMASPIGGQPSLELETLGNTVVENSVYVANAHRITYDQSKDMLILEGDGRNDARLYQQPEPGAPRSETAAKKFYYWPKTKRLRIDGAQSLIIGQFPDANPKQ